jgi:predicted nucleic acid-binding Zn ribbon protein
MDSLNTTARAALRQMLAWQPTTPAKVAFAWRMAAGAALGRAGEPAFRTDGVLVVRASTEAWNKELKRAAPMLQARLRELLGNDVIKRIVIE